MHCFNHQKKEAIAICCKCHKGICEECCHVNESMVTCSDLCTEKVEELNQLNERAKRIYGIGKNMPQKSPPLPTYFLVAIGLSFVALALYQCIAYDLCDAVVVWEGVLGILICIGGIMYWRRAKETGIRW